MCTVCKLDKRFAFLKYIVTLLKYACISLCFEVVIAILLDFTKAFDI